MVNTVAPYLLTKRLIEPLAASEGRVVNVATELFDRFRLTVEDLKEPARYSMFRAYPLQASPDDGHHRTGPARRHSLTGSWRLKCVSRRERRLCGVDTRHFGI